MKREVKLKRREMKKRIKYLEQLVAVFKKSTRYSSLHDIYKINPIKIVKTYPNVFNDDLNDEFIKEDLAYMLGMFLFDRYYVDLKKETVDDLHTRYVVNTYGITKGG